MEAANTMKDNQQGIEDDPTKVKLKNQKTGNLIQQIGMNMIVIGVLALLAFLIWQRFTGNHSTTVSAAPDITAEDIAAQPISQSSDQASLVLLSPFSQTPSETSGIYRKTNLKTIIPTRPRVEVITYTVQSGDTLFSIAANFGLKPETVLWGNFEVLQDNPHLLKPNQVLNLLPTNGTFYQWQNGDTIDGVASQFNAEPKAILDYPGNFIDLTQIITGGAGIEVGMWVIVPGGSRPIKDWGPPAITRTTAATARYYGEGACGSIYEGAVGSGTFVWPTVDHSVSGFTFDPGVHPAIDIAGQEGNSIFATDSGVVVYAGWSDYGYGYMIVIDHGNGWQSAYAHLSAVGVSCGQSVYQGGLIGAMGNTGNSSGAHLHFELSINGAKVNPLDYTR